MALVLGPPGGGLLLGSDDDDLLRAQVGDDVLRGLGGDDRLLAGAGDDRLEGGSGNDVMDGGPGTDTAAYAGRAADYLIIADGGAVRITDLNRTDGDDGTDRLLGIERIEFGDQVRRFDGANNPPVARDDNLTAAVGDAFGSVRVPVATLLANDGDVDGDALRVVALSDAVNGTATLFGDTVVFRGVARTGEPAGFRYTVADHDGATASATVFLAAEPAAVQASAFFGAVVPASGYQLWALGDDGPQPVSDAGLGAGPLAIAATDRAVFFARPEGGTGDMEFWRFDGISAANIHSASAPTGLASVQLSAAADRVFFAADDGGGVTGWELWVAQGEDSLFAFDIAPGPASSFPLELEAVGDQLFFSADDGILGREPWLLTGSRALPLGDLAAGPASSAPTDFTAFGGEVFFAADDGIRGRELWRWDGDQATLAAELRPGPGDSEPRLLSAGTDALFLVAEDGFSEAVWRFDGEAATPVRLGGEVDGIVEMVAVGSRLFVATDEGGRGGLWLIADDGVTRLAGPTALAGPPAHLTPLGAQLYFTASDGDGEELWQWDGQALTTIDVAPGPRSSAPRDLTVVDGALLFSAADGDGGRELWLFDGFSLEQADDDPFSLGYDPHALVPTPSDWPFA